MAVVIDRGSHGGIGKINALHLRGISSTATKPPTLGRIEISRPEPPIGQFYLLRSHLRRVFAASTFDGAAWESATSAFLAYPGLPVLGSNFTTQAPASFFLKLLEANPAGYPPDAESPWPDLIQRLTELGNQRVAQLIATDATQSWVIFLNEAFDQVLAFGGRKLPSPRHSAKQDEQDLSDGAVIREVVGSLQNVRVTKLERDALKVTVTLADETGCGYHLTFERAMRVNAPAAHNKEIARIVEIRGASGRTWFVFEPAGGAGGRKLAVQAATVSWRPFGSA